MILCFIPLVEESNEWILSTQWAASFLFMAFLSIPKLIIPKSLPAVLTWLFCIIIVLEIAALLAYTFSCCLSNKVHFKQTSFVLWKTPGFFFVVVVVFSFLCFIKVIFLQVSMTLRSGAIFWTYHSLSITAFSTRNFTFLHFCSFCHFWCLRLHSSSAQLL